MSFWMFILGFALGYFLGAWIFQSLIKGGIKRHIMNKPMKNAMESRGVKFPSSWDWD